MKLKAFMYSEFKRHKALFFLSGVLFIFILLRIPSLIEPSWYGDEGIYQVIGRALHAGRVLYKEIWDNKPPLLYITYALFNGELFFVRFSSLLFGVFSIVAFFALTKKLFKHSFPVYVATILYAVLFGLPLLEGNIANSENFMHLPTLLAFYLIVSSPKKKTTQSSIFAGVLVSLAFLFKIVAIFDFAAMLCILFIVGYFEEKIIEIKQHRISSKTFFHAVNFLKSEIIFITSFATPILVTILFFALQGALPDYFRAAFSQNVGYVGYGNFFIIPQGLLYLKLVLLFVSILGIVYMRKTLEFSGAVILTWTAFSLFNAFFSARPYTHYLLVLLPAFCLLIGYFLENKKTRMISFILLVVILFLVAKNFRLYKKNISYYTNYIEFVFSQKSNEDYQKFFDRITPRDYALAQFIQANTNLDDSIFLLSDSGQIYFLSNKLPPGRYIVSYHVTFYKTAIEETKKALAKNPPKYIIDTKHSKELDTFLPEYRLHFKIDNADIYERKL